MAAGAQEPVQSTGVNGCARDLGIPVIDEFKALRQTFDENPNELRRQYIRQPDGTTGHKSPFGNRQVAMRIMAALQEAGISIPQRSK